MTQLSKNDKHIKSLKNIAYKMCKSGVTYNKYVEFLNERIEKENKYFDTITEDKVYRYRELNQQQLDYLKKFFNRIFTEKNNKSKEKYDKIKSLEKEKKEFIIKKNEIIDEWKEKKMNELNKYGNFINSDNKNYYQRQKLYNEIHMYNIIVPNVYSRESLREYVLNH